ncbi:splicing factor YJU2 [Belonocnema kinseyi]|uniref:splicing factor YJU2 n=1 Tax=Belonocnema kinseyi TaxID=2817044 RepID=UPI00143E00CB|nr:splicing factor YJU2 [Belonocnema kinseyi]
MSERKVLNKYYPPDFDPSKIPRMKLARNRQYTVRLMAPFNMRCKTCGEYIYKGKKFNARKEDVEGDDYLGIRIYRFYIKCTRCLQEISFKTDPKNTDYEIEAGASRNFMALKMAEEQAQREEDEEREEEATNPMKLLEKRTQQSKHELELLESLEELKDLNRRQQTIDYEQMLGQYDTQASRIRKEKEQEELDEQFVQSIFKKKENATIVEEEIVELEDEVYEPPKKMFQKDDFATSTEKVDLFTKPLETVVLTSSSSSLVKSKIATSTKTKFSGLVKRKADMLKVNPSTANPTEEKATEKITDQAANETSKPSGLSLLGAYSDSEEESD